jgi:hypothetical protein
VKIFSSLVLNHRIETVTLTSFVYDPIGCPKFEECSHKNICQ